MCLAQAKTDDDDTFYLKKVTNKRGNCLQRQTESSQGDVLVNKNKKSCLSVCSRDMPTRCFSVSSFFTTVDNVASDKVIAKSCLLLVVRVVAVSSKPFSASSSFLRTSRK